MPAEDYDEPYWGTGKNIWWRFARADGQPWALAGLWNEWTDPATGEVIPSYTMLTMNCDAHPLLKLMHKPERDKDTGEVLPAHLQDKRTVIPLEREHWDTWLHGTPAQAAALLQLPALHLYSHGAAEPEKQVDLTGGDSRRVGRVNGFQTARSVLYASPVNPGNATWTVLPSPLP